MSDATHPLDPSDFVATARRAAASCAGLPPHEQAARLAADGLLGILAAEEVGGLALPASFAVAVVEAAAEALPRFPLAETILLARALEEAAPDRATALCEGRALATVAWRSDAELQEAGDDRHRLSGRAIAAFAAEADWLLVPVRDGRAALVETAAIGVALAPAEGIDVAAPLSRAAFAEVAVGPEQILDGAALRRMRAEALLLRSAAILGASAACLALASAHAVTRVQFGKPLSAHQAVRHNLARQKLTLESIRTVLHRAAAEEGDEAGLARLAAFAVAAQGGAAIAEGAIQVQGGMGFTWEVPLHLHLRRIRALAAEGDAPANADRLVSAFLADVAPADASIAR